MNSFKYFILAGGYGTRTQPLSFFKPKPIFPLNGKPLIRIILDQLKSKGLETGFINLHHMPDAIRECVSGMPWKPDIRFFYERELSGSRVLTESLPYWQVDDKNFDSLLTVNGDMFLDIPAQEMHEELINSSADGVILVRRNTERCGGYKAILTENGFFCGRKLYSCDEEVPEFLMYTGAGLFKRNVIEAIRDINVFDTLERNGFRIKTFLYEGAWLDIGDPVSYMESNFAYKMLRIVNHLNNSNTINNSLSDSVSISGDSVVEHSIIWENTEIKSGSVIKNCIVTGNVILDHVHLEDGIIMGTDDSGSSYSFVPIQFNV